MQNALRLPDGIRAAIFDMDGTILDSMPFWRFGSVEYLLRKRLPVPDDMLPRIFDTSSRRLLSEVLDRQGVSYDIEKVIGELEERMRLHYKLDVAPKPGAAEFLKRLYDTGVPMCVATATPRAFAREALAVHGLDGYFRFITDGYEIGRNKNDEEFFHIVASRVGAPVEACWMFEDQLYSAGTAKAAGMRVCVMEDATARRHREQLRALADDYVTDFSELTSG